MSTNKKNTFINPLTRPSIVKEPYKEIKEDIPEIPHKVNIEKENAPSPTSAPIIDEESESAVIKFEANHERFTSWVNIELKKKFDKLAKKQGRGAKSRLINEAIEDIIKKYGKK